MSSSNPQEEVYKQYLNYDWDSFEDFQQGLSEILQNYLINLQDNDPSITTIPALDKQQLINQAKVFFFCNHTGNILNLEDYEDWKLHNEDKFKKITEVKDVEMEETQPESTSQSNNPPYSSNYQQLVELIMSGKPVPGIKEIPDTVLTDQGSSATAPQRVKPWEKNKIPSEEDNSI